MNRIEIFLNFSEKVWNLLKYTSDYTWRTYNETVASLLYFYRGLLKLQVADWNQ